ncbi:arabinose-5-phosphate isomerase [Paenibacillus mucilaginosus]|uniref:KpsF/GutQ family sugar-phosphate isomerase n=1 Tax=Paenibacillus mucilaginosus TaxID=61624 RepID=UPI003D224B6E
MGKYDSIIRSVLEEEAKAIIESSKVLDLDDLIDSIMNSMGRIAFIGIGKSGLIARKIAASLSSIGVSSFFLHPTEALHGDLGMLCKEDIIIMLSNSGESAELISLIPSIKRLGNLVFLMTSRVDSTLAKLVDRLIKIPSFREADHYSLMPTVSSTVMLAVGDALAVALMKIRDFSKEDFAVFHPAGSIGSRLTLRVSDIMKTAELMPIVNANASLQEAIFEISSKGLGATLVKDGDPEIAFGIITDGDIRRAVEKRGELWNLTAKEIMCKKPTVIDPNSFLVEALELMELKKITILPVVSKDQRLVGIIHLHQIIQSGITHPY